MQSRKVTIVQGQIKNGRRGIVTIDALELAVIIMETLFVLKIASRSSVTAKKAITATHTTNASSRMLAQNAKIQTKNGHKRVASMRAHVHATPITGNRLAQGIASRNSVTASRTTIAIQTAIAFRKRNANNVRGTMKSINNATTPVPPHVEPLSPKEFVTWHADWVDATAKKAFIGILTTTNVFANVIAHNTAINAATAQILTTKI